MAPRDKYYTGSSVSRHLPAEGRSWDEVVVQSGKPVTDAAWNLQQEIGREMSRLLLTETVPSGWLRGPGAWDPMGDFVFPEVADPDFVADGFYMTRRKALVAGMPILVEYTETTTANRNLIQLDAATAFDGTAATFKRSDFVFLEVWRALISADEKSTGSFQLIDNASVGGTTITIDATAVGGVVTLLTEGVDYVAGGSAAATAAAVQPLIDALVGVSAAIDPTSSDTIIVRAEDSGTPGNGILLSTGAPAVWTVTAMTTVVADAPNKPTPDTLYVNGNVLAPSGVNLADDLVDPVIATELTKRVQIQYRIRVTGAAEGVNYKTEADGFSNANVLAQGAEAAPVATYQFVPADGATVSGSSDASAYGQIDNGLWIAGDGSSTAAADLGTIDGFVYAIPIGFVHRRNNAQGYAPGRGFDPVGNVTGAAAHNHGGFTNTVIGAIAAGNSDRPDGYFHDHIVRLDFQDLRRHVFPAGTDLSAELRRQMQLVLDGTLATWAVDGSDKQEIGNGSGDVSVRFLVCNEVGRLTGAGVVSGDTPRGETIADFDHIRRRFGDQPVVERVLFEVFPGDDVGTYPGKHVVPAGGSSNWYEGDVITLDLTNLDPSTVRGWDPAGNTWGGADVASVLPAGAQITNVLSVRHDDGNIGGAVDQTVQIKTIEGLGSSLLEITLDRNDTLVTFNAATPPAAIAAHKVVGNSVDGDVGSARRIFFEVEITYPLAQGTTDTPDETLTPNATEYPTGPVIENDSTQRPADFEQLLAPRFREGKRELQLEYVVNGGGGAGSGTPTTDYVISTDDETIYMPGRMFGSGTLVVTVTDLNDALPRAVDTTTTEYGSSSRLLKIDPGGVNGILSADQVACTVTYFPQDPIPNYGGDGYQLSVYFRTNAPQTVGTQDGAPAAALPPTVTVEPLVMAHDLWSGTVGSGSTDLPFPYVAPLDQIAINGDVTVPGPTTPGEWYFAAQATISVDDFDADTGLVNLHAMVPVDGTSTFTFSDPDRDAEFRTAYKVSDPLAYRPTVFTQPLSGAARHKVWMPFLVRMTSDDTSGNSLWRKNEVMLAVISRFAEFDDENTIRFTDTANESCVALYRTRGLLLLAGE